MPSLEPVIEVTTNGRSFKVCRGRYDEFWNEVGAGTWEKNTYKILERFILSDKCYIDIGAWIGPTLLYGSQLCRKAYAIEPDPIAFSELERNLSLNPELAAKTKLCDACLSVTSGETGFGSRDQGGDSMSSLIFKECDTRWLVKATTFENFVSQYNVQDCGFIKIDIEGGEYSILPRMRKYLKQHRPVLFLSLHPMFLGYRYRRLPRFIRLLLVLPSRLFHTMRILRVVSFYRIFRTETLETASYMSILRSSLRGRMCCFVFSETF